MGTLVKSALSALSSCPAELCPKDLSLNQFIRTYNGEFKLNFIDALSGSQSFTYLTEYYSILLLRLRKQQLSLQNLRPRLILQKVLMST